VAMRDIFVFCRQMSALRGQLNAAERLVFCTMSRDYDLTQPASTSEEPYLWGGRRPDADRDINYSKGPRGYYYPCFTRGTMDAEQGRPADAQGLPTWDGPQEKQAHLTCRLERLSPGAVCSVGGSDRCLASLLVS
jgi:hypothetical protein